MPSTRVLDYRVVQRPLNPDESVQSGFDAGFSNFAYACSVTPSVSAMAAWLRPCRTLNTRIRIGSRSRVQGQAPRPARAPTVEIAEPIFTIVSRGQQRVKHPVLQGCSAFSTLLAAATPMSRRRESRPVKHHVDDASSKTLLFRR